MYAAYMLKTKVISMKHHNDLEWLRVIRSINNFGLNPWPSHEWADANKIGVRAFEFLFFLETSCVEKITKSLDMDTSTHPQKNPNTSMQQQFVMICD